MVHRLAAGIADATAAHRAGLAPPDRVRDAVTA
jgi:hypothetical protein